MQIINAEISLSIDVKEKTELASLVSKLVEYDVTNYMVKENIDTIGTANNFKLVSASSISHGYKVSIYSNNFNIVNVLKDLNYNFNQTENNI